MLVAPALAAAAWAAYSRLAIDHAVDLPPALDAPLRHRSGPAGTVAVYADRGAGGRPLVLLHSINAAASAREMRPLFQHYRRTRSVIAVDLPGFGLADRGSRSYSAERYIDAITDVLTGEAAGGADVIALSLTAEFAATVAARQPELVRSLAMISPTGLGGHRPAAARRVRQISLGLSADLWRQPVFDLLVSRPSLRFFLGRTFVGPVDRDLLEYAFLTSHQPGAAYAPLAFVSGRLFNHRIADEVYSLLTVPTLVIYDDDPFITFDALPAVMDANGRLQAVRIVPSRGLPHWEKLPETAAALAGFWAALEG
ncbi:MAG: alpha/beta fold hydrolase [Nannocystaceae bacterium]